MALLQVLYTSLRTSIQREVLFSRTRILGAAACWDCDSLGALSGAKEGLIRCFPIGVSLIFEGRVREYFPGNMVFSFPGSPLMLIQSRRLSGW